MRRIDPTGIAARLRQLRDQKFDGNASRFGQKAVLARQQFDQTMTSLAKAAAAGETSNVSTTTLHKFAEAAGVSLEWLVYGEEAEEAVDPGVIAQRAGRIALAARELGHSTEAISQVLGASFAGGIGLTDADLLSKIASADAMLKGKSVRATVPEDDDLPPAAGQAKP